MESSPDAIEKQLEALIKWREDYRELLEAKHQKEREMLQTHNTFYAANEIEYENINNLNENTATRMEGKREVSSDDSAPELSKQTSGYSTASLDVYKLSEAPKNAPRRFLRRGEGIKQRFKIAPDAFSLSKLPPYKYANAHPNLRNPSKKATKPKASREKIIVASKSASNMENEKASKTIPAKLDLQEQHFQRLIFESKTVVNSTPEVKFISKSISNASIATQSVNSVGNVDESKPHSLANSVSAHSNNSLPTSIAWSKVLDPYCIKPISVAELRTQPAQPKPSEELDETDDENLNLFELLEEKAKEGSFNMNSSVIKRVLAKKSASKKEDEQDSDIIPITAQVRDSQILPKVTVNVELDSSESDSDPESSASDDDDDAERETCEQTKDETGDESKEKSSSRLHVRFLEDGSHTINEETANTMQDGDTLNEMNTEILFQHAKDILWNAMAQNQKNLSEATFSNNSMLTAEDIRQLAEKSKERLAELERQIALMKENNAELLKAKQEHELEKVAFMQQQEEALEQINDEKVKMEIQLHDERMKLEEDRRKLEEKLRMQKTAIVSAERKEIAKLKEEINALQTKLRDKEQAHIAAQGRLRSQLRCLEKEQKDLYAEIEHLRKENKRLEKLNAKLSREQNMTMLNEINRNIVKLAGTKNTAQSCTEIPSNSAKNPPKSTTLSRMSLRKSDNSREASRTLKITTSSFTNLLSNNDTDAAEDSDGIESDESMPKASNEQTKSMTTIEELKASGNEDKPNANDTTMSGFKVLTRETITEDGGKEILYPNGTLRKDSGDGMTVRMMYFNGDVKETNVNEGTIKYYYAKTNTWHTTYLDGLEILEFPNGQTEHRRPNGTIEIHFPNNSVKIVDPKDEEKLAEWRFHDGSILHEMRNGDRLLMLSNGQKELHTKQFKRREYPDGTVKTVYPDGSYETRYSNGRIRLKDKDGNLIMDSEMHAQNK